MSNAKDTQEIGWYDGQPIKKARKEQERSNQDKRISKFSSERSEYEQEPHPRAMIELLKYYQNGKLIEAERRAVALIEA